MNQESRFIFLSLKQSKKTLRISPYKSQNLSTMKNLQYALVLIFVFALSFAFAQENPYLLMDELNQTDLRLNMEHFTEIQTMPVGNNSAVDGETNFLNINIDAESMDESENKMSMMNDLANSFDLPSARNNSGENSDLIVFLMKAQRQDSEYS